MKTRGGDSALAGIGPKWASCGMIAIVLANLLAIMGTGPSAADGQSDWRYIGQNGGVSVYQMVTFLGLPSDGQEEVLFKMVNSNRHAVDVSWKYHAISSRADEKTDLTNSMITLGAGSTRAGEGAGLFFVPFPPYVHIVEAGYKDLTVKRSNQETTTSR